jgi:hypothetical protein
MRTRFFFLAASVTSIAAAAVAQGCGETETTSTPADGGAADAVADTGPKKDSAPAAEDAEPPCDTTKDFTKEIPDADLADGASSTGVCMACAKANCKKYIDDCTENCECQGLAAEALECYAKNGGDILKCIGSFPTNVKQETQSTGFALFQCLSAECEEPCQTKQFQDGGIKDAANDG